MKDFAKSVRTGNADLGLRPVVPQLVKDIAKIYEDNGKDREKTKQELIQKHHMSERQAEDVLRQIVGNSKVGNSHTFDRLDNAIHYASNLTDDALRRLNSPFSATNIVSDLSKCKQACDEAIKLAIQYDKERNK